MSKSTETRLDVVVSRKLRPRDRNLSDVFVPSEAKFFKDEVDAQCCMAASCNDDAIVWMADLLCMCFHVCGLSRTVHFLPGSS